MARDIGPKCKRCRKAKEKLFLRGEKCFSDKCVLMKRGEEPMVRGRRRRRISDYAIQLHEKQKLRMMYGVLERQFRNYYELAAKSANTAATLVILLERRLDNVVFRLGFANSRPQARQFVRHGHIAVDGRRVNIPSYLVKAGQTIGINGENGLKLVKPILADKEPPATAWLNMDSGAVTGKIIREPLPEDVKGIPCNTQLIVELYSK
ncbi:30S ribosomal protein S4 [candidate division WOR-3 bacterium JGI_Cruoil_03_51_56]|uniref:Small ribosomal subunit protein uS4 n=1 Tax=candidate division WOR-3 bacterium JGI_Cruoil_03_51_56 TaxID=1973747 RepID=A0A235BQQ1_UNCW3|nr:MAG: 30S ribosomal protein S4 [candidate division WOR-3 bacterium JGI_Cruoil_03_51_56]